MRTAVPTARRRRVALAGALLVAAAPASAAAPGQILTERGVRGLTLGRTLAAVRGDGLVGRLRPGCELASPRQWFGPLRPPLTGFATFSGRAAASRLQALDIRAGAVTACGIGIGSTARQVLRAHPAARERNSRPGDPLQFTAIVIARGGKDRMWFDLTRRGGTVRTISVPGPQFCE